MYGEMVRTPNRLTVMLPVVGKDERSQTPIFDKLLKEQPIKFGFLYYY
jgi:hypothetical protein